MPYGIAFSSFTYSVHHITPDDDFFSFFKVAFLEKEDVILSRPRLPCLSIGLADNFQRNNFRRRWHRSFRESRVIIAY